MLVIAGGFMHDPDSTELGRANARALVDELLSAAFQHGFKKGDILRTLLERGEKSTRVLDLALEAMSLVPAAERLTAMRRAGFDG